MDLLRSLKSLALQVPKIRELRQRRISPNAATESSPFWHYASTFDPIALITKYEKRDRESHAGLLTNFLGARVDPSLFGNLLPDAAGHVEPNPIPANWHADIAEWGAALLAVDEATDVFRIVELGCGWGCWLNNTGMAAQSRGLRVDLIGIEGDEQHISSALSTLTLNQFEPSEYRVVHAVAAPNRGKALFPIVDDPGGSWGSEPILNATDDQLEEASRHGQYAILDALPLSDLSDGKPIDLLHIDIQGGEADFVESNFKDISAQVKRVLIGTHSRVLEGRLIDFFIRQGWRMEMDRPAVVGLVNGVPTISVDGVHLYRNPRIR